MGITIRGKRAFKRRHAGRSAAFIYFKGHTDGLEVEFETEIPPNYVGALVLLLTKIHFNLKDLPLGAILGMINFSRHTVISGEERTPEIGTQE